LEILINGNLKEEISEYYIQTFSLLFFPDDNTFGKKVKKDKNAESNNFIKIFINKDNKDNKNDKNINNRNDIEISVNICYNGKESFKRCNFQKDLSLAAGKMFYEAASEITGIYPPWGIHTGIRPAKTAGNIFENCELHKSCGFDENKAVDILCGDYLMHKNKAALAVETYKNGNRAIQSADVCAGDFSLYISIPFCPTRCRYCSFVSYSTPRLLKLTPEYVKKLVEEIETTSEIIQHMRHMRQYRLKTIYIGGGTPTVLNCESLEIILNAVKNNFDLADLTEYTVECGRADTITKEKLGLMKSFNVDRISVNPQTLNDDILRKIGRNHTSEDFFKAFESARSAGINNINTDCIIGLYGETGKSMIDTISALVNLRPENITIHAFCIKRSAELKYDKSEIVYTPDSPELNNVSETGYNILKSMGYKPYYIYRQKYAAGNLENTGFCLDNKECLYNIYMMNEIHTIFGVGAGAMTKLVKNGRIERIANYKYPYEYIEHEFQINRENNKSKLKLLEE